MVTSPYLVVGNPAPSQEWIEVIEAASGIKVVNCRKAKEKELAKAKSQAEFLRAENIIGSNAII